MRRWVALLLAVALAGCGGGEGGANKVRLGDGERVSLDLPADQQPDKDDIRGAVSGIVVNEAIYPVEGALVTIKSRDWTNVTGPDGRFTFLDLPPGLYVAAVTKEGHSEGLGTINVKSGDVAKAVIMMPRLPYVAPYHETVEFNEFYSHADSLMGGSVTNHVMGLDGRPASLILEALWQDTVGGIGDPLRYTVASRRNETSKVSGNGPEPLRVDVDVAIFPANEYAVQVSVLPRNYAPPETSGRIFVTAFYVDKAPDGWSFVAGDQ